MSGLRKICLQSYWANEHDPSSAELSTKLIMHARDVSEGQERNRQCLFTNHQLGKKDWIKKIIIDG